MKLLTKIALTIAAAQIFSVNLTYGGNAKDFSANTALTSTGNYSPTGLPTSADDVRLTTSGTALTISSANVTMESLSAVNGTTYGISNASTSATNRTLTLGNSGGFTNVFSGIAGDLIFLSGGSNLTITGPNSSTGSATLGLVLASSGNFNVGTSSALTISSAISGPGFSITKTGAGTVVLSAANSYSGGTLISAGVLQAVADGALGGGNVSLLAGTATLTLSGGTTKDFIADSASLSIVNGNVVNLNFVGNDLVSSLIVNGVAVGPGIYGAAGINPAGIFTGTGFVTVVPEPSVYMLLGVGLLFCGQRFMRRKSA